MLLVEKVTRRFRRLLICAVQAPRVLFYRCMSTNAICGNPRRHQPIQCAGRGVISVEEDVSVGVFASPFFFSTYAYLEARHPSAEIRIGSGTWINNNFSAIAEHTIISIGNRCLIGANVEILDSDFHGMAVKDRGNSLPEWAKPVVIQNDVFIGSNVKVMKGVTIGQGSIIANGSIVPRDIPAGVIAGGNPAKVIRTIESNG